MGEQIIANESEVVAGKVVTFSYRQDGIRREGILLRTQTGLRCYENQCRHLPVKLDSGSRHFLTRNRDAILCQSHGALYELETGLCTRGPCEGASLKALPIEVRLGRVYLLVEDEVA
jgi:nitrite reductase/ring-hydroxylating ferredoxin subunit